MHSQHDPMSVSANQRKRAVKPPSVFLSDLLDVLIAGHLSAQPLLLHERRMLRSRGATLSLSLEILHLLQ